MSGGLFFGINIGVKGIMAQQASLEVIGHNVANANTPNYTRQRAQLETSIPISGLGKGQLGSGVEVAEIQRLRDDFIDYQIRNENSKQGEWNSVHDALSEIETVFMEPSETGFNELMGEFWNGWQELAKNAESSPIRTTLKETSVTLTDNFRHMRNQLSEIQDDLNGHVDILIDNVNSIGTQIARLNDQISSIKLSGDNPNDLLDRRDALLDELSGIGDIKIKSVLDSEGKDTGAINLTFGGKTLVAGNSPTELKLDDIKDSVEHGRLAGLLRATESNPSKVTTDSVQYYINKLDTLAVGLANEVNELHGQGKDLTGSNGIDFFTFKDIDGNGTIDESEKNAANMYVNDKIINDVSKIAAAATKDDKGNPIDFAKGNGNIALEIAKLKDATLKLDASGLTADNTGGTNFSDFYKDTIAEMGVATKESKRMETNQQALVNQLVTRRESVSGVSRDEEYANMISYQRAYQASAKVITTMDELLESVINMVR